MTSDITTLFPQFVPNQILTDTQLNQLRNYLCGQERLTRAQLIGTGIACGLDWTLGPESVSIGSGFGISSDGFVIGLPKEITFTKYRRYLDPDNGATGPPSDGVPQGKPFYPLWAKLADADGALDVHELLDDASAAAIAEQTRPPLERPIAAVSASVLSGRVVVLYLEMEPRALNSCLVTACDNKGRNVNLVVRALLVEKNAFMISATTSQQAGEIAQGPVRVPRLHTELPLTTIFDAAILRAKYRKIVFDTWTVLADRIARAFTRFGILLDVALPGTELTNATALLLGDDMSQYNYDVVRDLATAYNEFIVAACPALAACCPLLDFPRHLMLGAIDRFDRPEGYRHDFVASGASPATRGGLERARKLLLRLRVMLQSLTLAPPGPVTALPSHTEARPLGERAVPFYFKTSNALLDVWQPRDTCTLARPWARRAPPVPVVVVPSRPAVPSVQPGAPVPMGGRPSVPGWFDSLNHDYNRATFVHLDGHVGRSRDEAVNQIEEARRLTNMEFDLIATRLDSADESTIRQTLRQTLAVREDHRWRLRRALLQDWHGSEPSGEGLATALQSTGAIVAANAASSNLTRDRTSIRTAWRLESWGTDIAADYRDQRTATMVELRGVLGLVEQALLARWFAADQRRASSIAGGMARAAVTLAAEAIAERNTDAATAQEETKAIVEEVRDMAAEYLPSAAAVAALWLVHAQISSLLNEALPYELVAFNYDLFAERHRNVEEAALAAWLIFGIPFGRSGAATPASRFGSSRTHGVVEAVWVDAQQHPLTPRERDDLLIALRNLAHSSTRGRFAAIASVSGTDLSVFRTLAASVDGLEHLAGVEKGGTFVLVCDETKANREVVADFSLAGTVRSYGKLFTATPIQPMLCALDYRIVTLNGEGSEYGQVVVNFPIAANDSDPLSLSGHPFPTGASMNLLDDERSALNAALEVVAEGDRRVIRYTNSSPVAGAIDRFSYEINSDDNPDRASVLVLLVPEFTAVGGIQGMVTAGGELATGATVAITGTTRRAATDAGLYTFINLEPGAYKLTVSHDGYTTASGDVAVVAGGTARLDFTLTAVRDTTITVQVLDTASSPLDGATVILVQMLNGRPTEVERTTTTADRQTTLTPATTGDHRLAAWAPGYRMEMQSLTIQSGATIDRTFTLQDSTYVIASEFVSAVARVSGRTDPIAAEAVRDTYGERLMHRRDALIREGRLPNTIESFLGAMTFVDDLCTPRTDAQIRDAFDLVTNRLVFKVANAPDDAHKVASQRMLRAVSLALMDRVSASRVGTLSSAEQAALALGGQALKAAGIQPATVVAEWSPEDLGGRLGIPPPVDVGRLLG